MQIHNIEQYDAEGNEFTWIGVDDETARALWENGTPIYYVREDAEGLIEDEQDLKQAIKFNAVSIEDSYLWHVDFEEGAQNRFRNNDKTTFEEFCMQNIENILENY